MKAQLKSKPTISIKVQQQLKALKQQINEGHETVEMMKDRLKQDGNKILTEAILEGDRLIQVKKLVPYGSFGRWLKDNCKKISIRTAQRYMTLASQKARLTKTDLGLREAYAMLGIIADNGLVNDETDGTVILHGSSAFGKTQPVLIASGLMTEIKQPTLAQKAALKARNVKSAMPAINKQDALSRAKYLAALLTSELTDKLISNSIVKDDARQILKPLIELTQ